MRAYICRMFLSNLVKQFLGNHNVKKTDVLLVAVSGGMDSMLLWETLRSLGYKTIGVHINYKLRGEESDKDELLVRDYAKKHGLDVEVFVANPNNFKGNLQEKARIFRYEKFETIRAKRNIKYVCTAHHANDDAETFFVNLIRGAGIGGLKGISEKRDEFLRPFLKITKKQLSATAEEMGLTWREDQSNATDKYLRNKIRHHILPKFLALDPRAESGLQNSLSVLKNQNQLFKYFIEKYKADHLKTENGLEVLEMTDELKKMPQLLFEILWPYGNFNAKKILAALGQPGKHFISEDYTVWIDRNRLLIEKNEAFSPKKMLISEETKITDLGLSFGFLNSLPQPFAPTQRQAWLNANLLEFPLTLRSWQPGDIFTPFGMKGQKKISDYLTDLKMPVPLKKHVLVLTNKGKVVWLVGQRIDESYKVNKSTKFIYFAELLK